MVKMMITVVIIYMLCWLPLHSITLIGDAHPSIYTYKYIQTVWISCHWLAMSNCCYNPMVYCWMNMRFRTGFRLVFRCCPCVQPERHDQNSALKVKWNHTCVYSMNNGHDKTPYQRRMHRNCLRDDPSSSSTGYERARHKPLVQDEGRIAVFSLKRIKNSKTDGAESSQNSRLFA